MKQRLDYREAAPQGAQALRLLSDFVDGSGLDRRLIELVKTRASQLNSSSYCTDVHTKLAKEFGESDRRLYGLAAWRQGPFFSERERAALAWTDALTRLGEAGVTEEFYGEARAHFSEAELAALTMALVLINATNRLAIAFRIMPDARKEERQPGRRSFGLRGTSARARARSASVSASSR